VSVVVEVPHEREKVTQWYIVKPGSGGWMTEGSNRRRLWWIEVGSLMDGDVGDGGMLP